MNKLGIPAHIKGYRYIQTAILLAIEDMKVVEQITKILYPKIAEQHNTTPSRVERGIRTAIKISWDRGNLKKMEQPFGYSNKKPTNLEFIAAIAEVLSLKDVNI